MICVRKLVCFFLSGVSFGPLFAQSGMVTSGFSVTNASGSMSYSVGQVDYLNISDTTGSVFPGLQQPFELFIITDVSESTFSEMTDLTVYPNPAQEAVTLRCEAFENAGLHFILYDLQGKELMTGEIRQRETAIPLEGLSSAAFFIRIWSAQNQSKTIKIIKTL